MRTEEKSYEHSFDKRSRKEAMKYPNQNGSDEVFDKELCGFVRLPTEQHKRLKYGFYRANIISMLRPKAFKLYGIILYNTDKWQKTYIGNTKLSQYSNLSIEEISKRCNSLLNELEYYHLIHRHYTPHSKDKKKSRCIIVHRWDKALELLKKDGKIILDGDSNITSIIEPFLDYLKRIKYS